MTDRNTVTDMDWQQRVREEREQLVERLTKLAAYLDDPTTKRDDNRRLLAEQQQHMQAYLGILDQRISRFEP